MRVRVGPQPASAPALSLQERSSAEAVGRGPLPLKAAPPPVWGARSRRGPCSMWRGWRQNGGPGARTTCDVAGALRWRGLGLNPDFAAALLVTFSKLLSRT